MRSNDSSTYTSKTRAETLTLLRARPQWDLVIIGGGVTGAGIFKLATELGLRTLLLEQRDYAWGASSRSSKMVHGGLRYIAEGQIGLTRSSVRERQRLLKEAAGLVQSQSFVMSHYEKQFPGKLIFGAVLKIYDWLAKQRSMRQWNKTDYRFIAPGIGEHSLTGGSQFNDAITDDARIVLRLLQEGKANGGVALNYARVSTLLRHEGRITGAEIHCYQDADNCKVFDTLSVNAKLVVNATGAWNEQFKLGQQLALDNQELSIRPLRGSHLVVPSWKLPVASAISVLHPDDKRPVIIWPWMGTTLIGTTDVLHQDDLQKEAKISPEELDYLLKAVRSQFPDSNIKRSDIISTFAGVRPVVASKKSLENSKETREHAMWQCEGYLAVAGGKLTTFRLIAKEALTLGASELGLNTPLSDLHAFERLRSSTQKQLKKLNKSLALNEQQLLMLSGRYGNLSPQLLAAFTAEQFQHISYLPWCWAELIWAAQHEQVLHLDDLLLRRTRIGNLLPNGAQEYLPNIKSLLSNYLSWDQTRWDWEIKRYQDIWKAYYSLPLCTDNAHPSAQTAAQLSATE